MLETNGTLVPPWRMLPWLAYVSMDVKLAERRR